MQKSAHGFIAGVRFSRLEILHKSFRFFFCWAILKKARAQKIDKLVWFIAQVGRHEFANVDRIPLNLFGQGSSTAKTRTGAFATHRRICR